MDIATTEDPGQAWTVDPAFAALCPPLTEDERAQLESSILAEGCRDSLIVWEEGRVLLDGHNRFAICIAHDVPFTVRAVSLPDRDAAEEWIIRQQLCRRNATPEAQAYLRGRLYQARKRREGRPEKLPQSEGVSAGATADKVAAEHGVSRATVERDAAFARALDTIATDVPEVRAAVLTRAANVSRKDLLTVAALPTEKRVTVAKGMVVGLDPHDSPAVNAERRREKAKAKAKRQLHPKVATRSKATTATAEPTDETPPAAAPVLSERDQKIHDLLTEGGRGVKEIAQELGLSVSVVQAAKGRLGFVHRYDNPLHGLILEVVTLASVMPHAGDYLLQKKPATAEHIQEAVAALDKLAAVVTRTRARLLAGTFGDGPCYEDDEDDEDDEDENVTDDEQPAPPAPPAPDARAAVASLSLDAVSSLRAHRGAIPEYRQLQELDARLRPGPATGGRRIELFVLAGGEEALALLGLDYTVTAEKLGEAYKPLALAAHPDRGGNAEVMSRVNWAHGVVRSFVEFKP